jgi:hypothetical protein
MTTAPPPQSTAISRWAAEARFDPPIASTGNLSKKLLQIDVVVVDVALRDFGRADVRDAGCWRWAHACRHRCRHLGTAQVQHHRNLDQIEILGVRIRNPRCMNDAARAAG